MEISKNTYYNDCGCKIQYYCFSLIIIEDCGTVEEEEEPNTDILSEEAGRVYYHSYHLVVS